MYEIKKTAEDFIVEEITPEGEILEVGKEYKFKGGKGKHLVCVLIKKDWDQNLVLKKIARNLRISKKRIRYAGMKDKKAITSQRISIFAITPEEVEKIRIKDVKIFPINYSTEGLKLGDLKGNRFTIKVFSDNPPRKIKRIPNFFGIQRFGDKRATSHLIGKEIIKGNFKKAVEIMLTYYSEKEKPEAREARKRLAEEKDYKKALEYFPKYLKFERSMLAHLSKYPNDYVGALRTLPKMLRIMFVHAYQAYLFNKFLKKVIELNLPYEEGPLYGYELNLKNKLEEEILKQEGLTLSQFKVNSMPEMSTKGKRRKLFIELKDLEIKKENKKEYLVRFSLPKGSYATIVISALFGDILDEVIA